METVLVSISTRFFPLAFFHSFLSKGSSLENYLNWYVEFETQQLYPHLGFGKSWNVFFCGGFPLKSITYFLNVPSDWVMEYEFTNPIQFVKNDKPFHGIHAAFHIYVQSYLILHIPWFQHASFLRRSLECRINFHTHESLFELWAFQRSLFFRYLVESSLTHSLSFSQDAPTQFSG